MRRRVAHLLAGLGLLALLLAPVAHAQSTNPLSERMANQRIAIEENNHRLAIAEIAADAHRSRATLLQNEQRLVESLLAALPRAVQTEVRQQAESLYRTRVVPLREQWRQEVATKRANDAAADQARRAALAADAQTAAQLQAARVIGNERVQSGALSRDDFRRFDRDAEQQILTLQRKYDAFGPNWGTLFTQTVVRATPPATTELRLQARLADTTSELGRDAHRAAELTLAMQRNQVFREQRALTTQEEQANNAPLQSELAALQSKYAAGAAATDYRERVTRLVQAGAAEQRPQWQRDATAAREEREASAAAARAEIERAAAATAAAQRAAAERAANPQPGATQAAPRGAAPATAATSNIELPPELRPFSIPSSDPSGLPLAPVLALGLVIAAGGGFVAYRRRAAERPPKFKDARAAFTPRPAVPRTAQSSAPAAAPEPPAGTRKEQLFATQRDKYRARYSDGVDELTSATTDLAAMAPLLEGIHGNLVQLAKSFEKRFAARLARRSGGFWRLLGSALILVPVFRFIKRSAWLLRIAAVYGLWQALQFALRRIAAQEYLTLVGWYLAVTAALYVFEWYTRRRLPRQEQQKSLGELKTLKLAYVFDGQVPDRTGGTPVHHALHVTTKSKLQAERLTFPVTEATAPGSFLLAIGSLVTYRLAADGAATQVFADDKNALVSAHGDLIAASLGNLAGFAAATLPSLADYATTARRKDVLTAEVPRLEKLIDDVERLDRVWRDTYVSDAVFEFLFRSIDMFNMRDRATPPGILLYGHAGNGKKHLVHKIAESVNARVEQVNPSKLASAEEIAALWEGARGSGQPVVLFVPSAETVFPRAEGPRGREHTLEWIAEWEKHDPVRSRVWVIMTAKSDGGVDEGILGEIGRDAKIEIASPDTQGRKLVLKLASEQHQIPGGVPDGAASLTGGASVQDLIRIVKAVKRASTPHVPTEAQWSAAVQAVRGADAKLKDPTKTWERLVLPPAIKERLQVACRILANADEYLKRGAEIPTILLYGPPGTGKTEIARTIANEGGVNFLSARLADLKGNHVGDGGQNVRDLFAKARATAPTVLFIDEIDSAVAKRDSGGTDQLQEEIVAQMLAEMEGVGNPDRPVFVLGATNFRERMDRAILSRFSDHIEIPVPDEAGRRELAQRALERRALAAGFAVDDAAALVARQTPGRSGRDVVKLIDRAVRRAARAAHSADTLTLTRAHLEEELAELKRSASAAVEDASWDTLVVGERTLAQLKQIGDALRNAEARVQQGIDPPRGAVLFGPPGTGKTQIARTLAKESGVQVLLKEQSDIKGGGIGGAAQRLKEIFDEARSMAPCILFIDELDACASARSGEANAVINDEIVTALLVHMDGIKGNKRPVFVLAATNYLERIDEAVRSRFNYEIEVPYPTPEQRERLFKIFLGKYKHVDFDVAAMAAELAPLSGEMGGRDIRDLIGRAANAAAERAERAGTAARIVVSRTDLLAQLAPEGEPVAEATLAKVWSGIVLAPELKESLLARVRMFNAGDKAAPKGLLLYGPPGTGKTQVARLLAQSTNCLFLDASPATLKGENIGGSGKAVKDLWAKARAHGRAVIFIDECDAVFGRRGSVKTDQAIEELVGAFLPLWDGVGSGGQIWVVGATNRLDRLDAAIQSRFGTPIEIGMPGPAERLQILRLELTALGRDAELPEFLAEATTGFSGRKLAELAKNVCTAAASRGGALTPEIWREVAGQSAKATSDAVATTATWDTLILADATLKRLKRICQMLRHAEALEQQGVDVPRAALLHGPPGTGKTQVARTLAVESGLGFVSAKLSDMKAGYTGQSVQFVREIFERARTSAPCILFIDELEAGAADRSGGKSDQFTDEIVNEILTQMEGVTQTTGRLFVLAATNHRHLVDQAVLSRFEEQIEIPNPGLDERRRMVEVFLRKRRVDFDVPAVAAEAAARSDGLSGRALAALVRRASQSAAERAMDENRAHDVVMTRADLLDLL